MNIGNYVITTKQDHDKILWRTKDLLEDNIKLRAEAKARIEQLVAVTEERDHATAHIRRLYAQQPILKAHIVDFLTPDLGAEQAKRITELEQALADMTEQRNTAVQTVKENRDLAYSAWKLMRYALHSVECINPYIEKETSSE